MNTFFVLHSRSLCFSILLILSLPVVDMHGQGGVPHLEVQVTTLFANAFLEKIQGKDSLDAPYWFDSLLVIRRYETAYASLHPILYFGRGESRIPDQYQQFSTAAEAKEYRDWDAVEYAFYRGEREQKQLEVLNVLGRKLAAKVFAESRISLTGAYSAEEGESARIADQRAANVRDYLVKVWKVKKSQIVLRPSQQLAESEDHTMAQSEARCVQIESRSSMLDFIEFNTSRYGIPLPLALKVGVNGMENKKYRMGHLEISSKGKVIGRGEFPIDDDGNVILRRQVAMWALAREPQFIGNAMTFVVILEDENGRRVTTDSVTIPIVLVDQGSPKVFRDRPIGLDEYEMPLMGDIEMQEPAFRAWLGVGVEPSVAYEVNLNAFDFRSGHLNEDHRTEMKYTIQQAINHMKRDPDRSWRMKVIGSADATESYELDAEVAAQLHGLISGVDSLSRGELESGRFTTTAYFFPADYGPLKTTMERTIVNILREIFGSPEWVLDRYEGEDLWMGSPMPMYIGVASPWLNVEEPAKLRAREVAEEIRAEYPELVIDSLLISADAPKEQLLPDSPEVRRRSRHVRILFYNDHSTEWYRDERVGG